MKFGYTRKKLTAPVRGKSMRFFKLAKFSAIALAIMFAGFVVIEKATTTDALFKLEFSIELSQNDLQFEKIMDYDLVRFGDHSYFNIPGKPMLPVNRYRYALPEGMLAENIEIVAVEYEQVSGEYSVFPSQPPVETRFGGSDVTFIPPDINIYNSSEPYPGQILKLVRQSDLAGQSFAEIDLYPLQYIPAQRSLQLISKITFIISGNDGYRCGDYFPETISEKAGKTYLKRLQSTITNAESISMKSSPAALKLSGNLPPGGPYDHVIITSNSFGDYFQPLVFWHNRKGVRDTVIAIDYIYTNYEGSTDKEKIRNFIIDAHQNWGTVYFLIGGEHTTVPFEFRQYDGDAIPSDAYYADYDGDWEYEVYVGRITAEGENEITRFVNKVLEYETEPPELGFSAFVTLLGMDLTGANDPPYYTLTRSEWLKDTIDIEHIPPGVAVSHVYDTDGGNHRDAFLSDINQGKNLINHSDHSNSYVMGCGDRNHGWFISSYDVPYLTNYHRYCNIFSLGCYANNMTYEDAISEKFVFLKDSTGAVSFTGNTRSGWFYVGDPMSLSSDLDLHWWIGIMDYDITRLGEALAFAKSATSVESVHPYSDWTLNLLGEPEMPLWTGGLIYPIVTHEPEVNAIPQQFSIHVERFGPVDIENAFVCLWKGSEIYERGYTDADGNIVFDIYPTTNGPIYVTVTGQNILPYRGEAQVVGNVPPQCIAPGDTLIFQCSPSQVMLPVGCFDPDDNLVAGPTLLKGSGQIIDGYWVYTPSGNDSVEVTITCTDSENFTCETTFIVKFTQNEPPQLTVPGDTSILAIWPPAEIIMPVGIVDENMNSCVVVSGPGLIEDGFWRYTPDNDDNCDITIQLTDGCGLTDENTFHLDYEVYKCGDADDNGDINILDVTYLINHLYKSGPIPDPYPAGDPDANGTLNILDITYLISYLYKNGPEPQCP